MMVYYCVILRFQLGQLDSNVMLCYLVLSLLSVSYRSFTYLDQFILKLAKFLAPTLSAGTLVWILTVLMATFFNISSNYI